MNAIRKLLHQNGLLPDAFPGALHEALRRVSPKGTHPPVSPWTLRAAAHERALSNDELSAVLGHIARHALTRNIARVEFTVLLWNNIAIEFFETLGATPNSAWTTYRLSGEWLEKLAKQ